MNLNADYLLIRLSIIAQICLLDSRVLDTSRYALNMTTKDDLLSIRGLLRFAQYDGGGGFAGFGIASLRSFYSRTSQ